MSDQNQLYKELMPIFQTELSERLQAMNQLLLTLEGDPMSAKLDSLLEEIFREAHSLKGAARSVGLNSIADISHKLESIFSSIKQHKLALCPELFDLLYRAVDAIGETMQLVLKGQTPPTLDQLLNELDAAPSGQMPEKSKIERNHPPESVTETKASKESKIDVKKKMEKPIPITPEVTKAAPANTPVSQGQIPPAEPVSDHPTVKMEETVRITTVKLDSIMNRMGELLVAHLRSDQRLSEVKELYQEIELWLNEWDKFQDIHSLHLKQLSVREESISKFLEKTQTQMKAMRKQTWELAQNLYHDIKKMSLTTDELQDEVKKIRMLPASVIFEGFERMVRDLAREENKKVKLSFDGAETEIDKKIIEEIKDPLIHLLRNCVDHGIESPQERLQKGKPSQGTINLSVSQRGSNIVVEVADDGAGIDVEKIKTTAVKKGYLTVKEAEGLSDKDAMGFIFKAGFSTSRILTAISGRGVGMDVVREKMERLHGLINYETSPNKGTKFTLVLPLTLSTAHVCLIKCEGETFAIPISAIERIVQVDCAKIASLESKMAIDVDGHPVALVDLAQVLQLVPESRQLPLDKKLQAVILGSVEKRVAFLVDSLLGESRVVIKNLGRQLQRVRNIAGATILSTGKVIMILNVNDLIKTVYKKASGSELSLKAAQKKPKNKILVVDDSITTRILEKNILESAGYEVMLASDGDEAWKILEKQEYDLVVSDINMPHMNGFDLTAKLKHSEHHKEMPVLLVTSLASREDRERGIEVGADAYIIKSSFDQNNLLETIKRLI